MGGSVDEWDQKRGDGGDRGRSGLEGCRVTLWGAEEI